MRATVPIEIRKEPVKRSLADRLEAAPNRYLLLFTAIYFIAEACSNLRRPFWIDELIMIYLGGLPSIRQIWPLIQQGIELNPPLPFWITWLVTHAAGSGELMSRLPGIAGFWIMCVCLFHFVRRRSDAVYGFLALLLPVFTYTAWDGTWARGYGLMLGCAAAALLSWQRAAEGIQRRSSLEGLAIAIAGAVSCHYYAAYVAGAIGCGELVRTRERRRADLPVWIALLLGLSPLIVFLPLLRIVHSASYTFWIQPKIEFLYASYADLIGPIVTVLLLGMALALRWLPNTAPPDWHLGALGKPEITACLALAAMPLSIYLASLVLPLAFYSRYVQLVVIGYSALTALFLSHIGNGSKRFRNLTMALVVGLCFMPWSLWQVSKLIILPRPGEAKQVRLSVPTDNSLPVVIDHDNDYLIEYHYAPASLKARLFFLLDPAAAVRYLGSDTGQRTFRLAQTIRDLHIVDYQEFTSAHRHFYVARTHPEGWVVQKLLADGAHLNLVSLEKERGYFVEDSLLFEVTIPATE